MSIILPDGLPARWTLKAEGLQALSLREASDAARRPLRVLLINLMPDKPATERQIARLLAGTPHAVELTLAIPDGYRPKTADPAHIWAFYKSWRQVRNRSFDGLVVTGAPVETLDFEAVTYWSELTEIFDWARRNVRQSLYICWAAQAALWHFHRVPKRALGSKLSGVYRHRVHDRRHPLFRGFGEEFVTPVSRHTEVRAEDLPPERGLDVLASAEDSGLCAVADRDGRALFMFNHLEYEADTLAREYRRDLDSGAVDRPPHGYFPDDDPAQAPSNGWCLYGRLLFGNWLDGIRRASALGAVPETGLWARMAARWQMAGFGGLLNECR